MIYIYILGIINFFQFQTCNQNVTDFEFDKSSFFQEGQFYKQAAFLKSSQSFS